MKNETYISIIIITLNEEKNIANILADLQKQTFQNFEIIVSDSNSADNTQTIVESYKNKIENLRFENCGKTIGPAYGRNYGASFAKYERLLFLDADTRISDKDFLSKFIKIINEKKIDAGSMYFGSVSDSIKEKIGYNIMNAGFYITQFFSPTAVGAFMFSTKKVHNQIKGFREDVQLCEDCDYVRDAKREKFKVSMIPLSCGFSDRRLKKEGMTKMGWVYLKANLIRFITGKSIKKDQIEYKFGEY